MHVVKEHIRNQHTHKFHVKNIGGPFALNNILDPKNI